MWKRLAAKELIEALKCLKAARVAPVERECSAQGRPLASSSTKADFIGEAEACFSRMRRYRNRAKAAA